MGHENNTWSFLDMYRVLVPSEYYVIPSALGVLDTSRIPFLV